MQDNTGSITDEDALVCDLVATNYFDKTIEEFFERKICDETLAMYYSCKDGAIIIHAKDTSFLYAESFVDYESHLSIFCSGLRSAR